jgi:outer membrane protein OmpA-like peptidoglycan-associated protein
VRFKQTLIASTLLLLICTASFASTASRAKPPILLRYTLPAETPDFLGFFFTGALYYASDVYLLDRIPLRPYIQDIQSLNAPPSSNAQLLTADVTFSLGITRSLGLTFSLPVYGDFVSWGESAGMLGDLTIAGTFIPSLFTPSDGFRAGGRIAVITPTGNIEKSIFPRHVYYVCTNNAIDSASTYTYNKIFIHPSFITTLDLQKKTFPLPLKLHLNVGTVLSDRKECITANGAFAVTFQPIHLLQFSLEFTSETRLFKAGRKIIDGFIADPLRFVPSGTVNLPGGLSVMLAGDIGLSNGKLAQRSIWHRETYVYSTKATPTYGAALSLTYSGNLGKLIDRIKRTRSVVLKGDRDRDSIPDTLDTCRETPEDRDGFEDSDGCPEYDNDNDGIVDEVDGCPNNPEDNDNFEDKDGCPDYDNDNDRIPDTIDACPDKSGLESNRGCPEEGPFTFNRTVLNDITFERGTSKISGGSASLDRIIKAMKELPRSKIEIQVHTDNRLPVRESAEISQRRADVLKLYLVAKGIRPDRIKALGLGSEFPIADNTTSEGRAKNSRVEVRRTE